MIYRFLLIYAACLLSLVTKGIALGSPFGVPGGLSADHTLPVMATIIATIFLPGFLLGVISCWHGNNNNSNLLKTIVAHPSVVLMPTFTFYTFTSSTKWCKGNTSKETQAQEEEKVKATTNKDKPFITFSPKYTLLNIALSIAFNIVYGISMTHIGGWRRNYFYGNTLPKYLEAYLYTLSVPIFGLLFTLSSLPLLSESSRYRSAAKYNLALNLLAFPIWYLVQCSFLQTLITTSIRACKVIYSSYSGYILQGISAPPRPTRSHLK